MTYHEPHCRVAEQGNGADRIIAVDFIQCLWAVAHFNRCPSATLRDNQALETDAQKTRAG